MSKILWFVKNRLINLKYRVWDVRLAVAHRVLRTCQGRMGNTRYTKRAYRLAKFIAPEPVRVGRDIL